MLGTAFDPGLSKLYNEDGNEDVTKQNINEQNNSCARAF